MPINSRTVAELLGIFSSSGNHVVQIIILAVVAVVLIGYFVFRIGQGGGRARAVVAPAGQHEPDAAGGAASDEATLRLVRAWTGIIGAAHEQWNIAIDGIVVGSIGGSETVDVAVEPGHHTLRLEARRHRSAVRTFDVAREEVVGFRCHGPRIWPMLVVALINPNLWISLRPG